MTPSSAADRPTKDAPRTAANARRDALYAFDAVYWDAGVAVAGMDEVGRGPLAGPVYAACVMLPREPRVLGVDDSKKLSAKARERLYAEILDAALFVGVGSASEAEIDEINILSATRLAMTRAAEGAPARRVLVDAMDGLALPMPVRSILHGDATSYHIAAASIVAKVTRDRLMAEMALKWPEYGFDRNMGYGTAEHIAALRTLGPCPIHRRSFIGHFWTI